ncbi:MAG: serine hydrolase [Kordiimonas sp.]
MSKNVLKFIPFAMIAAMFLAPASFAFETNSNKTLSTTEIDQLVEKAMKAFHVPGVAVGIIKDGEVVHAKGYGVRHVGSEAPINEKTLFSIGSISKSFTVVALVLLEEAGKLHLDDRVVDHLPNFRLYDSWVTREFRIRDLLIHNSGLGLGAGDLMFFPSQGFSRSEIVHNLRYLKPVSSFRSKYAYDNLLYIVAGELISKVANMPYEQYVDTHILEPLGMDNCAADVSALAKQNNIADPHILKNGALQATERDVKLGSEVVFAAAGGLQCSVESTLKWHQMFLSGGQLTSGEQFISTDMVSEILSPQTIMPLKADSRNWFGSSYSAYGLAWVLSDFHGYQLAQHSGGLLGMLSLNAMVPSLNLGIVVYTNQQAGYARPAIMNQLLESFTVDSSVDWIAKLKARQQKQQKALKAVTTSVGNVKYIPLKSLDTYKGAYKDSWFGIVHILEKDEGLYFQSQKSERLKGRLIPLKEDIFIARWDDRTLNADAYVKFIPDFTGIPNRIEMKAVSPATDFSFDFHDLNFKRVPG